MATEWNNMTMAMTISHPTKRTLIKNSLIILKIIQPVEMKAITTIMITIMTVGRPKD